MDSAAQFLRWGIPGWVSFLLFYFFCTIDNLFCQYYYIILPSYNSSTSFLANMFSATFIGIPLGFLIYQIYFGIFQSLFIPEYMDIRTFISEEILSELLQKEIIPSEDIFNYQPIIVINKYKSKPIKFLIKNIDRSSKISKQWHYVQCIMRNESLSNASLLPRWSMLSGLFHSLGTVEVATAITYISYFYIVFSGVFKFMESNFIILFAAMFAVFYLAVRIIFNKYLLQWDIITKTDFRPGFLLILVPIIATFSISLVIETYFYSFLFYPIKIILLSILLNSIIAAAIIIIMKLNRRHLKSDINTFMRINLFSKITNHQGVITQPTGVYSSSG